MLRSFARPALPDFSLTILEDRITSDAFGQSPLELAVLLLEKLQPSPYIPCADPDDPFLRGSPFLIRLALCLGQTVGQIEKASSEQIRARPPGATRQMRVSPFPCIFKSWAIRLPTIIQASE